MDTSIDVWLCGVVLNFDALLKQILYRGGATDAYYQFNNGSSSGVVDSDDDVVGGGDDDGFIANSAIDSSHEQRGDVVCANICRSIRLSPTNCDAYRNMNVSKLAFLIKLAAQRQKERTQEKVQNPPDCTVFDNSTCLESFIHKSLVGYCFPVLLTVCVLGNFMNLVVYTSSDLRKSTTVKMLMAKSVVNTLFMIFLLPLSLLLLNDGRSKAIDEQAIWSYWPYFMFLSNTAGTCAAWLTVMMTFERFLFVTYPMRSRLWCTTKNCIIVFAIVFVISSLTYIEIPAAREAESIFCPLKDRYVHRIFVRNGTTFKTWEQLFYYANICLHVMLPCLLMTFCTAKIAYELLYCSLPTYSERKQCVTRITMATTICHLVLESPAIVAYGLASFYGPTYMNDNVIMCVCHVLTNFASQLNASICCLLYISCSEKYRTTLFARLTCTYDMLQKSNRTNSTVAMAAASVVNNLGDDSSNFLIRASTRFKARYSIQSVANV